METTKASIKREVKIIILLGWNIVSALKKSNFFSEKNDNSGYMRHGAGRAFGFPFVLFLSFEFSSKQIVTYYKERKNIFLTPLIKTENKRVSDYQYTQTYIVVLPLPAEFTVYVFYYIKIGNRFLMLFQVSAHGEGGN